jgi:hypothetical protein
MQQNTESHISFRADMLQHYLGVRVSLECCVKWFPDVSNTIIYHLGNLLCTVLSAHYFFMISVMAPYWGKLFPDVSDTTIYNLGNVLCRAYNVICTLLFTISAMAPYCGKLFSDILVAAIRNFGGYLLW